MSLLSVSKNEKNSTVLEIEVSKEKFDQGVKNAIKKQSAKMTVPGFRKGKAPTNIVVKYCGGEKAFYEDAVNELYPEAYSEALKESGIEPVDRADIEIVSVDENGFKFKATVTVRPEVKLGKYKGLKAERKILAVPQSRIDSEVDRLREQASRQVTVSDRPAQSGDIANIDYEGFVNELPFEGGKAEKQDLKLGSNTFIPGFEDGVIGKNTGEEFAINVKFPEEYHSAEVAGKDAVFKIKLNEIRYVELPKLDDEFAKDVSEFDTLDALKADIKDKLEKQNELTSNNEAEDALIDQIIEKMTVEIPDVMIETALDGIVQDFDYRLNMQGLNLAQYLQMTGMDMDSFRKTFREQAEKRTKIRLALEEIVKAENLKASEEEIEAEYKKIADSYQMKTDEVKKYVPVSEIESNLTVGLAIDLVKSNASITDVEVKEEKEKKPAEKKASAKKAAAADDKAEKPAAKKAAPKKTAAKSEAAPKKEKKSKDAE